MRTLSLLLCSFLLCTSWSMAQPPPADPQTESFRKIIVEQTPTIDRLRNELNNMPDSGGVDQIIKRRKLLQEMFFARLMRSQAYEFTDQWKEAEKDYDWTLRYGKEANSSTTVDKWLNLIPARLGLSRCWIHNRDYGIAAGPAETVLTDSSKREERMEAYWLLVRSRLHSERLDDALKVAADFEKEAGGASTSAANYARDMARAKRYTSIAHFLKGNLEAAKTAWQAASGVDGKFARVDLFDENQVRLNLAVSKSPGDPNARLQRAKYFLERARLVALGPLDTPIPEPGKPVTQKHQGGFHNLCDLGAPNQLSLRQDALDDISAAFSRVRRSDRDMLSELYSIRARAREAWNSGVTADLQVRNQAIADDYIEALRLEPHNPLLLRDCGYFFDQHGTPQAALEYLSRSLALQNHEKTRRDRDRIFAKLEKKPIQHPADLKTALDWKNRGNALIDTDPLNALACYQKAVEIDPKFADGWNNVGAAYNKLDLVDRAIEAYTKAIELNAEHRLAYSGRSDCYAVITQHELAKQDASMAIRYATTPAGKSQAYASSAVAKEGLKDLEGAQADYRLAIEQAPESAYLYLRKASLDLRTNHFSEAIQALRKLDALNKMDQESRMVLAVALVLNTPGTSTDISAEADREWKSGAAQANRFHFLRVYALVSDLMGAANLSEQSPQMGRLNAFAWRARDGVEKVDKGSK